MDCKTKIMSDGYADLIVDFDLNEEKLENTAGDFCFYQVKDNLRIFYVNRAELPDLSISDYRYLYLPTCYGLMQTEQRIGGFQTLALEDAGILKVQREPLALTGRGCILAVIDSGIDYTNAVFRNADGSSRILAIWDQEEQSGVPPEGFWYGSEYTKEQINQALESTNPEQMVPTNDIPGRHGTAIASIAAGSILDEGSTFIGAAPDAELVIVKLKQAKQYLRDYYFIPENTPCYQENDILTALKYVSGFAVSTQRPVCICLGIGTNKGDHSGNSLLEKYITQLNTMRNIAVVLPAGNEGNSNHHYRAVFRAGENAFYEAEIRVGDGVSGFIAEIWGSVPNYLSVSLRSPAGEEIRDISFRIDTTRIYDFVYEDTLVTVDTLLVEQLSGQQLVVFRFEMPSPGIWTIGIRATEVSTEAVCDIWLPITQFLSGDVEFLLASPYVTLTAPATGESAICVSSYNTVGGGFYQESGRGYTRDRSIKPDFSAPGVNVSSVIGQITGTSAAAAIAAGAVTQFMQWAVAEGNRPLVNGVEIKNYLIRGARRNMVQDWPNREQGYGQMDIYETFERLRNI